MFNLSTCCFNGHVLFRPIGEDHLKKFEEVRRLGNEVRQEEERRLHNEFNHSRSNGLIDVRYKNVIAIGESGAQKSALLSCMSNTQDVFKIGDGIYPQTITTNSKTIEISKNIYINFNDTPNITIKQLKGKNFGSPDTSGQQNIGIIVKIMQEILQIDSIWICVNASSPQYSPIKNIIAFFEGLYPDFLNHVELVFTNWVQPNPTRKITIEREFQKAILRDFNHENINCHFVDCFGSNENQIESLIHSLLDKTTFLETNRREQTF